MSWDGYVTNLCACEAISKATIIGLNGAMWTPGGSNDQILAITQAEATTIGAMMSDKTTVVANFAANGITVAGTKYMFLRDMDSDGKKVSAKKVGVGNLILQSTNQAVLVAFIPEDKNHLAGTANGIVDGIGVYLEGTGY